MRIWAENIKRSNYYRYAVPFVKFVLMCYGSWAYCHLFCFVELRDHLHHNAVAVFLTCMNIFLTLILWYIWIQIVVIGPGKQPTVLPFRIIPDAPCDEGTASKDETVVVSVIPPDIYQCDPQGYPMWCSTCQSLKIERSHHSELLKYCVPRFDHYCVWLGTVIGRKNYKLFMQYVMYFTIYLVTASLTIALFMKRIVDYNKEHDLTLNLNIIVLFILVLAFAFFVTPLFAVFSFYMSCNRTSLDIIQKKAIKRHRKAYFCVYNPEDRYRYVVDCLPAEQYNIWNKRNAWLNIKEFIGSNIWLWFIPIGTNISDFQVSRNEEYYNAIVGPYREDLSDNYKSILLNRINQGDYVTRLRVYGDEVKERCDSLHGEV
ncbi:palmitoyltransferase PFA5 Ecym_4114 [Eremothecium cymbalariae DBVPG|uniref:Palmitoyltransferase n=1 Tax=Eremothecium cymbalariae (strain CBS 270.75 / DBVPG 7215 / KCTC 17166 / NRRL Y-17582) TaxID=931890 RepID=G8JT40_ERECY|nr:hypothetical protein Ecym_4114 [Eremothecium cymbalariae DBVPG\